MKKGTTIGFSMLILGIILWIAYGLYIGFEELLKALDIVTGLLTALVVIGIIILFISIIFEQHDDTKKMKQKIKKEDLEP
jgi:low affinity Fe/Cu permease